jgi:hypothetical protein
MGALSSWGALALLHHMLVQYAAHRWRIKQDPLAEYDLDFSMFTSYRVLGDDIVIANSGVAEEYLELCKDFQIPLSLHKSFVSDKGMFSFASEVFLGNKCMSPISILEDFTSTSLASRLSFGLRLYERGWLGTKSQLTVHKLYSTFLNKKDWIVENMLISNGVLTPGITHLHRLLCSMVNPLFHNLSLPALAPSWADKDHRWIDVYLNPMPPTAADVEYARKSLTYIIRCMLKEEKYTKLTETSPASYHVYDAVYKACGLDSGRDEHLKLLKDADAFLMADIDEYTDPNEYIRSLFTYTCKLILSRSPPAVKVEGDFLAPLVAKAMLAESRLLKYISSPSNSHSILQSILTEGLESMVGRRIREAMWPTEVFGDISTSERRSLTIEYKRPGRKSLPAMEGPLNQGGTS